MKTENPLLDKSLLFVARIVKLNKYLVKEKRENTISKQIIRSATSIGANANEAIYGNSKADFIAKLHIALKECSEGKYWLELLIESGYYDNNDILEKCIEVKKLLVTSINTAKSKMNKQ